MISFSDVRCLIGSLTTAAIVVLRVTLYIVFLSDLYPHLKFFVEDRKANNNYLNNRTLFHCSLHAIFLDALYKLDVTICVHD